MTKAPKRSFCRSLVYVHPKPNRSFYQRFKKLFSNDAFIRFTSSICLPAGVEPAQNQDEPNGQNAPGSVRGFSAIRHALFICFAVFHIPSLPPILFKVKRGQRIQFLKRIKFRIDALVVGIVAKLDIGTTGIDDFTIDQFVAAAPVKVNARIAFVE